MSDFKIDPSKLPKQIEIDVPQRLLEQLEKKSKETGRSLDELLLELLDKEMGEY